MIICDHRYSSIVFSGGDIRPISDGEFGHDKGDNSRDLSKISTSHVGTSINEEDDIYPSAEALVEHSGLADKA
uniref:Uncharacterized protein n=1 Tax=Acrobeloides nanus TaxID=290746 RepID=A0A914E8P0_9BILA